MPPTASLLCSALLFGPITSAPEAFGYSPAVLMRPASQELHSSKLLLLPKAGIFIADECFVPASRTRPHCLRRIWSDCSLDPNRVSEAADKCAHRATS